MAIEIKHATVAVGTNAGNGEIAKEQWNEGHAINMATGKLLGRSTAGTGVAEEISIGSGLSLSAGTLSATGGGGGGGGVTYTGTASAASWTGSGPYTQTVTVTGVTSSDTVILDLNLSSAAFADVTNLQFAYAQLYRAVPGTNTMTLYATAVPSYTFDIYATVI